MKEAVSRIIAALILAAGMVIAAHLWPGRWVKLTDSTLLDTRSGRICLLAEGTQAWQCVGRPGPDRPYKP